ncbi:MAG: hypothetical protein ACOY0T_06810 [Myxococcota bacterium]
MPREQLGSAAPAGVSTSRAHSGVEPRVSVGSQHSPTNDAPDAALLRDAPHAALPNDAPHAALLEPAALKALEAHGFSLSALAIASSARSTRELSETSAFRSVFAALRDDLRSVKRMHPLARPTSMDGFRLFDERWLRSDEMSFQLSGVFNRVDRRVFYAGSCGEIRFLYRLRYRTQQGNAPMQGKLPLTVNLVFLLPGAADCSSEVSSWSWPEQLASTDLVAWLETKGPLAPERKARWTLKSLETNLQTFRLQSSVHPTLAGHIEYVLRVFHPRDDTRAAFDPAPLENMPDVPRLQRDKALRESLRSHLRRSDVLQKLDLGVMELPEQFLAKQAVSVAPRSLTRVANRPFLQLFSTADFQDLNLSSYRSIASPRALLRRLDGMSCNGCHQSRSIAGFHHIGMDESNDPNFNSLLSGSSPYLEAELARREHYLSELATGKVVDEFRPIPERQPSPGGYGSPCGLGDAGFREWTCNPGLRCVELEDNELGVCLSDTTIGAPCEYGRIQQSTPSHRDQVSQMQRPACGDAFVCNGNFSGFPLGECTARCSARHPDASCADFLDVDGFQNCLRGHINADSCAERFVFPDASRACDSAHPCRQDYVCVRTRQPGIGACVPPYFVYQLRLDGYPLPR